ncbi:hypothetical protein FHT86_007024 [Rhizobium sp. BK313]|nr:hypothetical protein [Rhizobium sp. BK313]
MFPIVATDSTWMCNDVTQRIVDTPIGFFPPPDDRGRCPGMLIGSTVAIARCQSAVSVRAECRKDAANAQGGSA